MLNNKLPISREEKHYTAFLLPSIILHSEFTAIGKFFKLIGVPKEFLKENYSIDEIEILPEYSLKKINKNDKWSTATIGKKLSVPDLVILIKLSANRNFLIVIEGKVFSNISNTDFRNQLDGQKEYIDAIMEAQEINKKDILHLGILMNEFEVFQLKEEEKIIIWDDILNVFKEQKGTYAYEYLNEAVRHQEELVSKSINTYRKNCTDLWTIYEIIEYYSKGKEYSDFIVGSQCGIRNLKKQIYNGVISLEDKCFEVNLDINTAINNNWYHVNELIEFINNYDGFNKSVQVYN